MLGSRKSVSLVPRTLRVPPVAGVPPAFVAYLTKPVLPAADVLPPGVGPPPLLLPPQAVATVARAAIPARAATPRDRVRIDTLLLGGDELRTLWRRIPPRLSWWRSDDVGANVKRHAGPAEPPQTRAPWHTGKRPGGAAPKS